MCCNCNGIEEFCAYIRGFLAGDLDFKDDTVLAMLEWNTMVRKLSVTLHTYLLLDLQAHER